MESLDLEGSRDGRFQANADVMPLEGSIRLSHGDLGGRMHSTIDMTVWM